MTLKKILVATDFSKAANLAVERAGLLARRHGAQLRLLHSVPPLRWLERLIGSKQEWSEQVRGRAAATLKSQAAELAQRHGIEVSTALVAGKASVAIAEGVDQFGPGLLIVGASGEGQSKIKRTSLGQTASKLIGATQVPLLLTRRMGKAQPSTLAALDLTSSSVRVARWAQNLAAGSRLTFVHVFEAPFTPRLREYGVKRSTLDTYTTEEQAKRERMLSKLLRESGMGNRADKLVLRGDAVRTILAQLRKQKADILVVGKHGRRKRDASAPYGSVCRYLTQLASSDVLVVP